MMWIAVIITAALTLAMVLPGTFISLGITENTLLAAWVILGIVVYVVYRKQDIVIERLPVPAVQNEIPADAEPPQGSNVGSLPAIQAQ